MLLKHSGSLTTLHALVNFAQAFPAAPKVRFWDEFIGAYEGRHRIVCSYTSLLYL